MQITVTMTTEDADILENETVNEFVSKLFVGYRLISSNLLVYDDDEQKGILELKDVTMELGCYNNLWCLAKLVHNFKLSGELTF